MGSSYTFTADVSRFVQKTKLRANQVLRKIAFDAFYQLLLRSPVDTGRFRGSWRIGVNKVDLTFEPPMEKGSGPTPGSAPVGSEIARAEGVIKTAVFGDTIHISNSLDYGEFLENGSSRQAPQGMLRLTFEHISAGIDASLRRLSLETA